jgi:hypothetical protein
LSRARNGDVVARGKKFRAAVASKAIEAKPARGQIRPSEVARAPVRVNEELLTWRLALLAEIGEDLGHVAMPLSRGHSPPTQRDCFDL